MDKAGAASGESLSLADVDWVCTGILAIVLPIVVLHVHLNNQHKSTFIASSLSFAICTSNNDGLAAIYNLFTPPPTSSPYSRLPVLRPYNEQ